jgi:hypothetical protein
MHEEHQMTSVKLAGSAANGDPTGPLHIEWLTSAEVMRLLRIVSPITLRRYIDAGLPVHQPMPGGQRLFDRAEVNAWIKSRWTAKTPGQQPSAESNGNGEQTA